MEKKYACYLCKGCEIGEALDFEALTETINDDTEISEVKEHQALCSPEGVAMIQADVEAGYNALLLAACSPRSKTDEFDFPGAIVERCSLREQVVWCSEAENEGEEEPGEDRLMLAQDYLRMHAKKLAKGVLPEPFKPEEEVSHDLMVVGAGPAGMSAALEAAAAGSKVHLVEKEPQLGGFLAKMNKLGPETSPYQELEDTGLPEIVSSIEGNDLISVYTGATVEKTAGAPGLFDVTLSTGDQFRVGAVVQATGWLPYPKENLAQELSSNLPGVLSNVEMEEKAKSGDLGGLGAVAFVQCAGSRDENHLAYCSAVCCTVSCKQAMYVKQANPEASVYVIYRDVRTPNQGEEVYREAQRQGVVFIKRPEDAYPQISESGGKLVLETKDLLLDEDIRLEDLDLVVLATGMKPNNPKVVEPPLVALGDDQAEADRLRKEAEKASEGWSVLNLQYRQGPNLPTLKYAMPDSNFICFPYESRRTGIYSAGAVRRPMRKTAAVDDGLGAALKAIQAMHCTEMGEAVHPRYGDESYPEFAMTRCTQCKRCTDECPFGAINEDEKANPLPNITRCRRCGTCMGACPERIISFKNYSVDMIGSMIKSIEVPEEEDEKPRVVVLVCENDALPAIDMAARLGKKWSSFVRFVPVRCLGSVNLIWIADAMSAGIDGFLLFGCRRGDDYQCHFVKGSELANVRMSKISETLDRLMLESERVRVEEVGISDLDRIPQIIEEFMEKLDELGPNPMKGF